MAVFDLYSKRKLVRQGKVPELQVDDLPRKFRHQVLYLFIDAIGKWMPDCWERGIKPWSNATWEHLLDALCREHGFQPADYNACSPAHQCANYLMSAKTDETLDLMELGLRCIDRVLRDKPASHRLPGEGGEMSAEDAIEEFNTRCWENGVGYAYEDGFIVPVSSSFVHTEMVDPAFRLLNEEEFAGAHEEFMNAHRQLRAGDFKNAIVEAAKAFESTMKAVCSRKKWNVEPGAAAKKLIETLLKNGFVEPYLESQLTHVRCLLETGVPVIRNKDAAHGQGVDPVEVPRELAEFAIHLTAANIVFLVKRFKA